jgi:hypothetical protein
MFPRLRERLDTAIDVVVEFSTLGEYRLAGAASNGSLTGGAGLGDHAPGLGGAGHTAGLVPARRAGAGGATGCPSVATPAARRLVARAAREAHPPELSLPRRPGRPGTPAPPVQPCLAASRR